jgi:hypothetical protein
MTTVNGTYTVIFHGFNTVTCCAMFDLARRVGLLHSTEGGNPYGRVTFYGLDEADSAALVALAEDECLYARRQWCA